METKKAIKTKTAKEPSKSDGNGFQKILALRDAEHATLWNDKWPAYKKAIWVALVCVWAYGALFLPQLIVGRVANLVFSAFRIENYNVSVMQAVLLLFAYILLFVMIVIIPAKVLNIAKPSRSELGFSGEPTWKDLLLGPGFFVLEMLVTLIAMSIIAALIPGIDMEQAQDVGFNNVYSGLDRAMAFITLVVMAPIAEEFLFRGWLYAKLRAHMKALPAILIVSLLFAIAHGQINVGIAVFIMSVAMCIQRELTGTVYSGIIVHMLKNGFAFFILYVIGTGSLGV